MNNYCVRVSSNTERMRYEFLEGEGEGEGEGEEQEQAERVVQVTVASTNCWGNSGHASVQTSGFSLIITGGLPGRISGRRQGYACRVVAHEPRRAL